MTLEDYRRVAGECMREGAIQFSFQGGEPLLLGNLLQLVNVRFSKLVQHQGIANPLLDDV